MQINNSTSPNFKALLIEPTAKEALRKYDNIQYEEYY